MTAVLRRLASLRLTLAGVLLLAAGMVADQNQWLPGLWALTPPLGFLALNLAAAMTVDPRFRRQPALFAFHLCLLLLTLVAGYGQLARFEGRLPLTEGQAFAADLVQPLRVGPLAPRPLPDGAFRQGAVTVDYAPGLRRGATRSQVWVPDRGWLEVGDTVPLQLDGYRLYTTSNKGFAVLLRWLPEQGGAQLGALPFPSYPATQLGQRMPWSTPAGQELQLTLALPPSRFDADWTLSTAFAAGAALAIDDGRQSRVLQVGEVLALDGGRLRYERLGMWMGYEVSYDPTLPWLFSLAALAMLFMSLHFGQRVWRSAPDQGAGAHRVAA